METDLSSLNQRIEQLTAEMALLKAQQGRATQHASPWLSLKEAAVRLNFRSARSLRRRIKNGQFPPDCFRVDPTTTETSTKYLVHVERYIKQLR